MNNSPYALPSPIKWSIGSNPFKDEKKPHQLSLQIPVESIPAFCEHLMSLEEQKWSHCNASIYNYQTGAKTNKSVVYIRAGGREGLYGTMNPRKLSGLTPSHPETFDE